MSYKNDKLIKLNPAALVLLCVRQLADGVLVAEMKTATKSQPAPTHRGKHNPENSGHENDNRHI